MDKDYKSHKIHKKHFALSKNAIEKGFYLEALVLEYAYIETRVNKIMETLEMPCALIKDIQFDLYRQIGLVSKLICLASIYSENVDNPIFEKAKMNSSDFKKTKDWCHSRNERIHNLYLDIDKYDKLVNKNEKLANQGYEYVNLLAQERTRLKELKKKHPELFKKKMKCYKAKKECVKAKKESNKALKNK